MIVLPFTLGVMLITLALCYGRIGLLRLAALRLHGGALATTAVIVQALSIWTQRHRLEALLVSALLLGAFCWRNRKQTGIMLAALGIILNLIVMIVNGGIMPISPTTIVQMGGHHVAPGVLLNHSKDMVLHDDAAALVWLSDWLLLPGPLAQISAWSIGDVLLLVGVSRLLWSTMKGANDATGRVWDQAIPSRIRTAHLYRGEQ